MGSRIFYGRIFCYLLSWQDQIAMVVVPSEVPPNEFLDESAAWKAVEVPLLSATGDTHGKIVPTRCVKSKADHNVGQDDEALARVASGPLF